MKSKYFSGLSPFLVRAFPNFPPAETFYFPITVLSRIRKSYLSSSTTYRAMYVPSAFVMNFPPRLRRQTASGGKSLLSPVPRNCASCEEDDSEVLKVKLFEFRRRWMMHMNTYPVCGMKKFFDNCPMNICCGGKNSRGYATAKILSHRIKLFQYRFPYFPSSCIEHFSHHSQIPFSLLLDIGSLHSILIFSARSRTLFVFRLCDLILFHCFRLRSLKALSEITQQSAFNFVFLWFSFLFPFGIHTE